jgi:hypothetical protein
MRDVERIVNIDETKWKSVSIYQKDPNIAGNINEF